MAKLPIIYSDKYNITLLGIQKLHPFDSEKYGKIYDFLRKKSGIGKEQFHEPLPISDEDLLYVHTKEYIKSLDKSANIASIAGLYILGIIPNPILQRRILTPMRYATGGSLLGAKLALENGWAINLSGGYHHAKSASGGGFCVFSDIALAVAKVWEKDPTLKVLIIDLDVHQGNGYASIFKNDPRVFILDIYNSYIYPQDHVASAYIDYGATLIPNTKDDEYLEIVDKQVGRAITACDPDLIIYNAGTDIYKKDLLGGLSVSREGIIKRDEIVFKNARQKDKPILMLPSGGYHQDSANIIGKSIENLLKKVLK